jgi:hypothetical protein
MSSGFPAMSRAAAIECTPACPLKNPDKCPAMSELLSGTTIAGNRTMDAQHTRRADGCRRSDQSMFTEADMARTQNVRGLLQSTDSVWSLSLRVHEQSAYAHDAWT